MKVLLSNGCGDTGEDGNSASESVDRVSRCFNVFCGHLITYGQDVMSPTTWLEITSVHVCV